jgi:hypothetical protein
MTITELGGHLRVKPTYDCGAGIFETGGPSFTCTYLAAGTFNVRGRIADKDGGFTEYAIAITALAPAAAMDKFRTAVEALDLAEGFENSLDAKLEAAQQAEAILEAIALRFNPPAIDYRQVSAKLADLTDRKALQQVLATAIQAEDMAAFAAQLTEILPDL